MNPFSSTDAARLYAAGRPFYHPQVASLIRPHIPQRVAHALDVACGTGLSTRILLEFADQVTGCDASQPMLDAAFQDPRINYRHAPAMAMPLPDGHLDLITLGSGLHWLDGTAFVQEAVRLLTPGGLLVIYDHGFTGEMACCLDYSRWHREHYLTRFPSPPRNPGHFSHLDPAVIRNAGLSEVASTAFDHYWPFSTDGLARYLMSQSNVLSAVEETRSDIEDVRAWIIAGASSAFNLAEESFRFTGMVTIWRRMDDKDTTHGR